MAVTPINTPDRDADETPLGLDDLTAAETAMAERKAGQSITTLGNDAFPQVTLIGALGWVLARRRDQRLTFDRYMESRTVTQITRELGLARDDDDDEDDADAAGKSPAEST
jgi:hypothetical protein